MTVKIVFPKPDKGGVAGVLGTRVYTQYGHEIEGITRIQMDLRPDDMLMATFTIFVSDIENAEGIIPQFVLDKLKQEDQEGEDDEH